MARGRSQGHLRWRDGYDSRGRTAYEFGERTRWTPEQQYDRAVRKGHHPPPPDGGGTPTYPMAQGTTGTAVVTSPLPPDYGLSNYSADFGLMIGLDPNDPNLFGGALPMIGEPVSVLLSQRARPTGLLTNSFVTTGPLPTFDIINGKGALKFVAASLQSLEMLTILPGTASTDYSFTFYAVVRMATTPNSRMTILGHNRDASVQNYREVARLLTSSNGTVGNNFQCGSQTGANTDVCQAVATTPWTANTTCILIGSHGTAAAGQANNKLLARFGGATATAPLPATNETLNFTSAAAHNRATLGGLTRTSAATEYFNGWVLDMAMWRRELSTTEKDALMAFAMAKHGVA